MGDPYTTVTKQWMTVEEMATYLGIGRSKAYELVRQEGFPSVKIGKIIRVSCSELSLWLKSESTRNIKV